MRFVATILFLYTYVVVAGMLREFDPGLSWLVIWPIAVVLGFFAVLVHEAGHAFTGRAVGYRIKTIMVFPFEVRFRPLRLALAKRRPGSDIGGYVAFDRGRVSTPPASILISAAGPAANVLLAIVAVLLALWFEAAPGAALSALPAIEVSGNSLSSGTLPADDRIVEAIRDHGRKDVARAAAAGLRALAVLSTGMGVANLVPFRGSDGQQILRDLKVLRAVS